MGRERIKAVWTTERPPDDGEQGGFLTHDTVSVIDPVPHKRGRSLQNVPEKADHEPGSERKDRSTSPFGLSSNVSPAKTERHIDNVAMRESEEKGSEKTDGHVFLALSPTKGTVNSVVFECPIDRCEVNDCYVAYPLTFS